MAIAGCRVNIVGRNQPRCSAVASAAYMAAEKLLAEYDGKTHDYTRKSDVIFYEILAPSGAPEWAFDIEKLTNKMELCEKRCDAQLGRTVQVDLPRELTAAQNIEVARAYASRFTGDGMVALYAVHDKGDGNPHAHFLLTTRNLDGAEFGKKNRDWNKVSTLERWRKWYAEEVNRGLRKIGSPERIDHRSYERQGIDRTPTNHLGRYASQLEKKGIPSERGNVNREIEAQNRQREQLKAELAEVGREINREKDRLSELAKIQKMHEEARKREEAFREARRAQEEREREATQKRLSEDREHRLGVERYRKERYYQRTPERPRTPAIQRRLEENGKIDWKKLKRQLDMERPDWKRIAEQYNNRSRIDWEKLNERMEAKKPDWEGLNRKLQEQRPEWAKQAEQKQQELEKWHEKVKVPEKTLEQIRHEAEERVKEQRRLNEFERDHTIERER
jgi:hypothetical protein